jgi:hypothetical protein
MIYGQRLIHRPAARTKGMASKLLFGVFAVPPCYGLARGQLGNGTRARNGVIIGRVNLLCDEGTTKPLLLRYEVPAEDTKYCNSTKDHGSLKAT